MPERPDLEYVVPLLDEELRGRSVTAFEVRKPVVMRVAVPGDAAELQVGQRFGQVRRRGHFVLLELQGAEPPLELVIHPMLAGVFDITPDRGKLRAEVAACWTLDDGRRLLYCDRKQMGKVYLLQRGQRDKAPGLQTVGLDVLDPEVFTLERFRALCKKRRDQVRVFIMDKTALDSFGNAYADEVLFAAGIHPKTWTRQLDADDQKRLHRAMVDVLTAAAEEIRRRQPPLKQKLRDFLEVRGKAGEPCPRCGAKLRKAGVRGYDAHFCPDCQPERRKSAIVDWRKIKR